MKHEGISKNRLKREPNEAIFAKAWAREAPGSLPYILHPVEQGCRPTEDLTQAEATVAATVIQWLGSPVGNDFLQGVLSTVDALQALELEAAKLQVAERVQTVERLARELKESHKRWAAACRIATDAELKRVEAAQESEELQAKLDEQSETIANLKSAEAQLAAMTEDRDLWRDAHNDDCPNSALAEQVPDLQAQLALLSSLWERRIAALEIATKNNINESFRSQAEEDALRAARQELKLCDQEYIAFKRELLP